MVYSSTLKLESLEKEFNNTLNSYNLLYDQYLDYLSTSTQNKVKTDRDFIIKKGFTNVSNSILNSKSTTSAELCKDFCVANSSCKGATFINPGRICKLNKGDDVNIVASNYGTIIVPKIVSMVYELEVLNNALIQKNIAIKNEMSKLDPYNKELITNRDKKTKKLNDTYKKLVDNRDDLKKKIKSYEALDKENVDNSILLKRNLYTYSMYVIIFVCVVIFTIIIFSRFPSNQQVTTTQYGGSIMDKNWLIYLILFLCYLGLFMFSCYQKNVNYLIFWGLSILGFVYYFMHKKP